MPDKLRITIKQNFLFIAQESLQILQENSQTVVELPPQTLNYEVLDQVKEMTEGANEVSAWAIFSNFLVNFSLSTSLAMIWSLMNAL